MERPRAARLAAGTLAVLIAGLTSAPSIRAAATIDNLMTALSEVPEVRSVFREEKRLSSLTEPLVSRGTLRYVAPDRVEKRTAEPVAEEIVVDGDQLTYVKPAEDLRQTISLDAAPELRGLVEAVRGTLAGNLEGLRRYYSVGFEHVGEGWRLTLVPTAARVREFLKVVRIDGQGTALRRVETIEPNGDVTDMAVEPAPR